MTPVQIIADIIEYANKFMINEGNKKIHLAFFAICPAEGGEGMTTTGGHSCIDDKLMQYHINEWFEAKKKRELGGVQ